MSMRAAILVVAAVASTTIGLAQAPNAPVRGSASVRPPAWRQLRTAVGSLVGWQVGVPLASFRQDTFFEAAGKAEALGVAVFEGNSAQKVSAQIPKSLDYRLAPGEMDAVRDRMTLLNVRMVVYVMPAISEDDQIARKTFEFAKSLGVETLAVERMPASLAAIEQLAGEFAVNVALSGSAKALHEALHNRGPRLGVYADLARWAHGWHDTPRWNCAARRSSGGVEAQRSNGSCTASGGTLTAGVEAFVHRRGRER